MFMRTHSSRSKNCVAKWGSSLSHSAPTPFYFGTPKTFVPEIVGTKFLDPNFFLTKPFSPTPKQIVGAQYLIFYQVLTCSYEKSVYKLWILLESFLNSMKLEILNKIKSDQQF